jgi:hypothetical protein
MQPNSRTRRSRINSTHAFCTHIFYTPRGVFQQTWSAHTHGTRLHRVHEKRCVVTQNGLPLRRVIKMSISPIHTHFIQICHACLEYVEKHRRISFKLKTADIFVTRNIKMTIKVLSFSNCFDFANLPMKK